MGRTTLIKGFSMPSHEELFKRLQDLAAIYELIGKSEDLYLECKIWPPKEEDCQKTVAKALCGFANADGGVLVIGMLAKAGPNKDDPDVIKEARPVSDALVVKSRIENLVGQLVEPGLEGVQAANVIDAHGSKSSFVLVGVPPAEGFPCRSRKDWKFYQRISAGTFPMEYFQIADRFGKRRRPVLRLCVEEGDIDPTDRNMLHRLFTIGIENRGRGLAKFPSLRFRRTEGIDVSDHGIDGNGGFGLPKLPCEREWIVFGGGADHVIYPRTLLKVAVLQQRGTRIMRQTIFDELTFTAELAADEFPSFTDSGALPKKEIYR